MQFAIYTNRTKLVFATTHVDLQKGVYLLNSFIGCYNQALAILTKRNIFTKIKINY
jgi:hypothetical protein